jgi:translation initiation factor eIF-2B subunit delta
MQLGSLYTSTNNVNLHPAVLALGLQYADMSIRGANSRCKAMLRTFQTVIKDHEFDPNSKDFRQDLENKILKPAFTYWTTQCRPHSVTMGNAFTFLKLAVANLDRDMDIGQVKEDLCDSIDAYIQERIEFADKAICKHASKKIVDGDVILTYAKNEVIQQILTSVKKKSDTQFRVILVDSRPMLDGKDMLDTLNKAGIECSYIMFNAVSYVMKEVTKVFLGASALMSDGSIFSRVGTAGVALIARNYNVPVLVCTETYKISHRVQMESITGNELGNPNELISNSCTTESESPLLKNWRDDPNLRLLNPIFDLTPSEFVSGIVTEMGILPPTSVAVLLREMNPQDGSFRLEDMV